MKAIKISIFLFSAILLIGFAESVHALSFDDSFVETFGDPTSFKYKNGAFKFVSSLIDSEFSSKDWTVDKSKTVDGLYTVKADNTENIEGVFTSFEVVADVDNDQLFSFYGVLEQSGLTTGTLNPHNPWFIYGYFVQIGDTSYSDFKAYISNVDPHESGQVPEPATMMLLATGMLCTITIRRRRKI